MSENNGGGRLVLTFALSVKGMANATEIRPDVRPKARSILLEMRDRSIRGLRLVALMQQIKPKHLNKNQEEKNDKR